MMQLSGNTFVQNENDLHHLVMQEIQTRYDLNTPLASEMAWDLLELMTVMDANTDVLEKYVFES